MNTAAQQAGHALSLGLSIAYFAIAATGLVLLIVWFRRHPSNERQSATRRLFRILLVLALVAFISGGAQVVLLAVSPEL